MLPILSKIQDEEEFCPSIKEIRKWFGILNEVIFDGVVPKFWDIEIKKVPGQFAAAQPYKNDLKPEKVLVKLEINPSFPNFKKFIIILVHEMIHAWQWKNEGKITHGKSFFKWKDKLKEQGIPLSAKYHKKFLDIPNEN